MLLLAQRVTDCARADILNNQETDRTGGNMIADEKTIMELYAPPFEAVAGSVAGYMCRCGARRILCRAMPCCAALCWPYVSYGFLGEPATTA